MTRQDSTISERPSSVSDLEKNELHEVHEVELFKRFSAKLVDFSAKFGFLDVQITNNLKKLNL